MEKTPMEKTLRVLIIIFVIAIPGYLGFVKLKQWHEQQVDGAEQRTEQSCLEIVHGLEQRIALMEEELEVLRSAPPPSETMDTVFGGDTLMFSLGEGEIDCDAVHQQAMALFKYLDDKGYLPAYDMNMAFYEFFRQVSTELSAKPPLLSGELDDILSLLRNVTHFYRIFGKQRLRLLKDIIVSETEIIEPALAVLHAWMTTCPDQYNKAGTVLKFDDLYHYAGYFLNTLGGRSYLLRRESKIRMLLNYYSILILDTANDEKLNRFGIDIRPYIDFLFYDIINQTGLMYKERYMSTLAELRGKYQ